MRTGTTGLPLIAPNTRTDTAGGGLGDLVSSLVTRCMSEAEYVSTGQAARGRADVLREGDDGAILAVGPMVGPAATS